MRAHHLRASSPVRPDRKARRGGEERKSSPHQTDRKWRAGRLIITNGEAGAGDVVNVRKAVLFASGG
jgi:hypothetical protein